MIPAKFIDELVRRNDILDVVSEYVRLSKKGGNYFGLCPFHGEKTASFSVNQEKQIYHCFGCGKGGGVLNFIMEIENLEFVDAIKFLAKRVNMEVPEDDSRSAEQRGRRERVLALNKAAARFFHNTLMQTPEGTKALAYIQGRGLTRGTITRFGLGAAPDAWDALLRAMTAEGFSRTELLDAGLVVSAKDGGRFYDRFRNRLMFPIIDIRGNVIGFGGRVLDDSTPKYLNSPDTLVFNKSRNLFALNIAKKSKQGRLILTEGYMDVISLHQAGFDCAVASLGTALTADHAQLLTRYTSEVVICYDADGAGIAAAQRAIVILEKTGLSVKVLRVQGAKDPDEFIKTKGRDAFAVLLDRSENHIEYRLMQIRMKYDLEQSEDKVAFLSEAVALIGSLDSAVEREVYGGRVAEAAGVTLDAVRTEVKRAMERRVKKEKKKQERRELDAAARLQPQQRELRYENLRSARAEEGVIRLSLLDPELLDRTPAALAERFSSPLLAKIFAELKRRSLDHREVSIPLLADTLTPEEMSQLTVLAARPESTENMGKALTDYIEIITDESEKAAGKDGDLRSLTAKYREKKGYGG